MARYTFGGGVADWTFGPVTVSDTDNVAQVVGGVAVTFWSAESGGVQFDDLIGPDGQPALVITSSDGTDGRSVGQIPPFTGPDGVRAMWAQAGTGPRALMKTTDDEVDLGTILPPLSVPGAFTGPKVGKGMIYNDTDATVQVVAVRASAGTTPTAEVTVDINRNGASIFTTASNRPTIAVGATTSGRVIPLDQVLLAPGDYLSADVDTGSGGDLTVQVVVARVA